jgi:hypothetical protein
MLFEQDYFFHNLLRWNLGWATPNYAGAFLASLIPFLWFHTEKRAARWLGFIAEACLYFLLCKTYSRGAFLGMGAAALFYISSLKANPNRGHLMLWLSRVAVVFFLIIVTDLSTRIIPKTVLTDKSVLHRAELWHGALIMSASAPNFGWGYGESGRTYMNYLQLPNQKYGVTSMVNSYLTLSVEFGLWLLLFSIFVVLAIAHAAWSEGRSGNVVCAAAGASWTAWITTNMFSNLWIEPKLWIVPMVGFILIANACRARVNSFRIAKRVVIRNICISSLLVSAIWVAGIVCKHRESWNLSLDRQGVVEISNNWITQTPKTIWFTWPDTTVLGPLPGKELKEWVRNFPAKIILRICPTIAASTTYYTTPGSNVLLIGEQAERLYEKDFPQEITQLWILQPLCPPPDKRKSFCCARIVLILPAIDSMGLASPWKNWAIAKHAEIRQRKTGGSVESSWPDMDPQIQAFQ